jgi:alpha-glucosidase (family GH31 glycosyl hydrolase)
MHAIEHVFADGAVLRASFLAEDILRIEAGLPEKLGPTGLNRYGFITEPAEDARPRPALAEQSAETDAVRLTMDEEGALAVVDKRTGAEVLRQAGLHFGGPWAGARFAAAEDEDWIGFGDQTRDRLFHRGHGADCWVLNVKSYIPVPFFMSNRGVGVLVNTTHRVSFDMCKSDPDFYEWRDKRGVVDYYVFVGGDFRELIGKYTALAGRPKLPPEWAFGLWYICRMQANDYEVVNDAVNFRREGIPCDVIGLEPGWMEKNYDYSTQKRWHPDRFPIPSWAQTGPDTFIAAMKRMGFHFELWLCNNYDLSYEAERRIGNEAPGFQAESREAVFEEGAEVDEHFMNVKTSDGITIPEEPWFEHLKKFVDQGADFFKMDGSQQVDEHPDRLYANGMTDAEMHNLYPLLYSRQMHEGFEEYTGRRPVVFTPAGWTGFQAWCGTWTGDTGGGPRTLGAMLNTSLMGHAWCTNDMEVHTPEGLHFGYLQPWSQINSWTYFRMPWVQGERLLQMHREYSQLRARLIPYLYSMAWRSTETGLPMLAPLLLEFPDDPECRNLRFQYLLGRDLMATAWTDEAYFPHGRWKDYWTGQLVEGPGRQAIAWPEDRGGGLYVREGAIIPFGPLMQYRGERPVDEIDLYVFPGREDSEFALYEDDGVTIEHRAGAYALTRIRAVDEGGVVRVDVGETTGAYEGMPGERSWGFTIAIDSPPGSVQVNEQKLPGDAWSYDEARGELRIVPVSRPEHLAIYK